MQIVLDVSEFQSVAQLDQFLRTADDEIVGVYIKGTQGRSYCDALATAFAQCCTSHTTAFGYYDYMTNDSDGAQESAFNSFLTRVPSAKLIRMLDCEGTYAQGAAGVKAWQSQAAEKPVLLYAQLSNMPTYASLTVPKWVAQYDTTSYYRPSLTEIERYRNEGYVLWQWTDSYMGLSQDASVLLGNFDELRAA